MATLVVQPESITEQFGPHLSKSTGMRLDPGVVPDKVVNTHCCFAVSSADPTPGEGQSGDRI
jgi:assimilatory nitrate reductase catalytic subunit